jgi:hypothetical protein
MQEVTGDRIQRAVGSNELMLVAARSTGYSLQPLDYCDSGFESR